MKRAKETDDIESSDQRQENNLKRTEIMNANQKLESDFMKYEQREQNRERMKKSEKRNVLKPKKCDS